MKGGLIVGIFALKALATLGLLRELPVTWLFNSEEEIGSPVSRPLFRAEAGRAAMAFVLECGGMRGEVVTGRKGRLGLKLSARGRAGHAAKVVEGKKSAILDLARVIVELEEAERPVSGRLGERRPDGRRHRPEQRPRRGVGGDRRPLPERRRALLLSNPVWTR